MVHEKNESEKKFLLVHKVVITRFGLNPFPKKGEHPNSLSKTTVYCYAVHIDKQVVGYVYCPLMGDVSKTRLPKATILSIGVDSTIDKICEFKSMTYNSEGKSLTPLTKQDVAQTRADIARRLHNHGLTDPNIMKK